MISFIKVVSANLKGIYLFTGCTVLFYYGIMWVNEEYQNYHRYDEPEGAALRFRMQIMKRSTAWLDRLILFYLNGE